MGVAGWDRAARPGYGGGSASRSQASNAWPSDDDGSPEIDDGADGTDGAGGGSGAGDVSATGADGGAEPKGEDR